MGNLRAEIENHAKGMYEMLWSQQVSASFLVQKSQVLSEAQEFCQKSFLSSSK